MHTMNLITTQYGTLPEKQELIIASHAHVVEKEISHQTYL
jgi:hypothetical protein